MGIQVDTLVKGKDHYGKEFIDFEFDGKHISDFGMVAVFDGDRHTFSSISDFVDETSEVAGVHGQYYWGTTLKPLELEFHLATDGITEKQLSELIAHFQPGKYGEFIECNRPNRKRYGRLAKPIEFKLLPFKKTITLNGKSFYTTEYKGEADISFMFDKPFSYSCVKQINKEIKDAEDYELKLAYEDNIPFKQSNSNIIIGTTTEELELKLNTNYPYYNPSFLDTPANLTLHYGGFSAGNFPENGYLQIVNDEINHPDDPTSKIIIVDNSNNHIKTFSFTSPNYFYYINKSIQIIRNWTGDNIAELKDQIRSEIPHIKVMDLIICAIQKEESKEKPNFQVAVRQEIIDKLNGHSIDININSKDCTAMLIISSGENVLLEEKCDEIMRTDYLKLKGGDSLTDALEISHKYSIRFSGFPENGINFDLDYDYIYV